MVKRFVCNLWFQRDRNLSPSHWGSTAAGRYSGWSSKLRAKPSSRDTLPPMGSQLLSFPRQFLQLDSKYSNARDYGNSSMKQSQIEWNRKISRKKKQLFWCGPRSLLSLHLVKWRLRISWYYRGGPTARPRVSTRITHEAIAQRANSGNHLDLISPTHTPLWSLKC